MKNQKIIEIVSFESGLENEILKMNSPRIGDIHKLGNETEIKYIEKIKQKGFSMNEASEILKFGISIAGNVGVSLLANYLYDCLKNRKLKVWINNKELNFENKDELVESLSKSENPNET